MANKELELRLITDENRVNKVNAIIFIRYP